MVNNPSATAGDMGLIPGLGRSLGERNGNSLQLVILAWEILGTEEPGRLQFIISSDNKDKNISGSHYSTYYTYKTFLAS